PSCPGASSAAIPAPVSSVIVVETVGRDKWVTRASCARVDGPRARSASATLRAFPLRPSGLQRSTAPTIEDRDTSRPVLSKTDITLRSDAGVLSLHNRGIGTRYRVGHGYHGIVDRSGTAGKGCVQMRPGLDRDCHRSHRLCRLGGTRAASSR